MNYQNDTNKQNTTAFIWSNDLIIQIYFATRFWALEQLNVYNTSNSHQNKTIQLVAEGLLAPPATLLDTSQDQARH